MLYKNKVDDSKYSTKYRRKHPEKSLISKAKARAIKRNLECNITHEDIKVPEYCPILGIKLKWSDGKFSSNSATLDRINVDLGYIKGNVWVISALANSMKANSRFWHRALFTNWTLTTLLSNKKHLKHLNVSLLQRCCEEILKQKTA